MPKVPAAFLFVIVFLIGAPVRVAHGEITAEQVRDSLDSAIEFLKGEQKRRGNWVELDRGGYNGGVTALCTLALLEAGVPASDPAVRRPLEFLRTIDNEKTYVVSLQTMVFCRAGRPADRPRIRAAVRWLEKIQNRSNSDDRGAWGYGGGPGVDNSNTQFAVLALFAAEQAGITVQAQTWQANLGYWRRAQNANGSWGYHVGTPGRGSMTCAGIASMIIALDSQREGSARIKNGACACGNAKADDAIQKALDWMGRNFSVESHPDELGGGRVRARWHFYYLYGLERVGRVTARRFFVHPTEKTRRDWYREGAQVLLKRQNPEGSWDGDIEQYPHIGTAMALLFLAKGRRPVLVSKLQRSGDDWNRVRHDLTNLTRYAERKWKLPMTWQVIDSAGAMADDYSQTPVLFLSGSSSFRFTEQQRRELRRYIEQGGFIFADACCGGAEFDRAFKAEMREIFPEAGHELKPLDPKHPIWTIDEQISPKHIDPDGRWLWGIDLACKTSVVYCPGNLSCYWELDSVRRRDDFPQAVRDEIAACRAIGVNVLAYATGRKLKNKDEIPIELPSTKSQKTGERGHFAIAKLQHAGGCDAAPRALINLMDTVGHTLKMRTSNRPPLISLTDDSLFNYHFVYMHGRHEFRLSAREKRQLKTFVQRGGIVMADAICASPAFAKAFRREIRDALGSPLVSIPPDDPIFTEAYGGGDVRQVTRREAVRVRQGGPLEIKRRSGPPELEGVVVDDRYGVIFSPLDLSCALEKHVSPQCRGYTPEDAARVGINIILYSLNE